MSVFVIAVAVNGQCLCFKVIAEHAIAEDIICITRNYLFTGDIEISSLACGYNNFLCSGASVSFIDRTVLDNSAFGSCYITIFKCYALSEAYYSYI